MKRLFCIWLSLLLVFMPCHDSKAPVYIPILIKCIVASGIATSAILIFNCEPSYYLIRVEIEGEETYWLVSQASLATVKKNEGWTRCEGPWKERTEPDFRAWVNNQNPYFPMFPCGPLGVIPGPTRTNWLKVTIEQDLGQGFQQLASLSLPPNEDNYAFALLPQHGTNGMNLDQIIAVKSADVVVTNAMARVGFIRTKYEEMEAPTHHDENN